MTQSQTVPAIPKDLLEWLDKAYPEQSADPSWNDRELWMRSGERRLVRQLRARYDEQNEQPLSTTTLKRRVSRKATQAPANSNAAPAGPSASR